MSEGLHEADFHDWLARQAGLLRRGAFASLDVDNLVEEIEALGRGERDALKGRVEALLTHLLKWQVQVMHRSAAWSAGIRAQRSQVEAALADSPSLRLQLDAILHAAYPNAVRKAQADTGFGPGRFPAGCPCSVAQLLDDAFLPA